MKRISTLIEELQLIAATHGDINVTGDESVLDDESLEFAVEKFEVRQSSVNHGFGLRVALMSDRKWVE